MPGINEDVNIGGGTMFLPLNIQSEPIEHMDLPSGVTTPGWVYVLKNKFMPGIYKIGMTTNEPESRAIQISQGTGIPAPFDVFLAYFSDDPKLHEEEIHTELSEYRVSPNREFFQCPEETLTDAFDSVGLISRSSDIETIANRFQVICLENDEPYSLDRMLNDLDIPVFGCKWAAVKRLVEVAKITIDALDRRGCALILKAGQGIPIIRDETQQRKAYQKALEEAGAYGPTKPWSF